MNISRVKIENFRGVQTASIILSKHSVLIGDNNVGKTTVLEAIDLVLGPDRLNRTPPIDEHDFYQGKYIANASVDAASESDRPEEVVESGDSNENVDVPSEAPRIEIEVTITDLTVEQKGKFGNHIEFWNKDSDAFYVDANPEGVDTASITEALRITFIGAYDMEQDDFDGKTYFTRSLTEEETPISFTKKDKQVCGFLYLRSLRTGSRALSLERGSLLDIILRLKEVRPQMWEDTLKELASFTVASDPGLGISGVLESINNALKKYVPKEWGIEPHLKVSNMTREHLRKVITAFIATGEGSHAAPFYRQGTGTINMLVLAMLSQIAEDRQNVIFAMEEPEIAIPPYAQKRIVHEIRHLASQTIFTSHSPYVLEEFKLEETIMLSRDNQGVLSQSSINLPENIKLKRYRQDFRTRFCEGLLARRILLAEGATEASSVPVVCRRLSELNSNTYSSLEALGICAIDAGGETKIPSLAKLYKDLGKSVYAICDKQTDEQKTLIENEVDNLFMHEYDDFEDLVLNNTTDDALKRFANLINWPQHLREKYPVPENQVKEALKEYFLWSKANWGLADFFAQCNEDEIPQWLRDTCILIKQCCEGVPPEDNNAEAQHTSDAVEI